MRVDLNGIWLMNSPHYHDLEAQVPGSVPVSYTHLTLPTIRLV